MSIKRRSIDFRGRLSRAKETLVYRIARPVRFAWDARTASPPTGREIVKVALVSDGKSYCSEQQIRPFRTYRRALRDDWGIVTQEFRLSDVLRTRRSLETFDVVGLKLSFRMTESEAREIVGEIASLAGSASLMYLDGDDDICIQWPSVLDRVDVYVKKHAFKERGRYTRRFEGKSNLHDYAVRELGHKVGPQDYGGPDEAPFVIETSGPIPERILSKIQVGWNIGLDPAITDLFERRRNEPLAHDRDYDITFRGSAAPRTIVAHLRGGVEQALAPLSEKHKLLLGKGRVDQEEYYREMLSSRICVSPFGFGEICWRDFEAVLCGALLVKPDMGHIETTPNIYLPRTTYVPVKWDLSDLSEVCDYYLTHEAERRKIVERAFLVLGAFYESDEFPKLVDRLIGPEARNAHSPRE